MDSAPQNPSPTRITLARVAKEAHVSITTASLILSGRQECLDQFQADTIDRVRQAAERLGYRANLFAASLLAKRSVFFAMVLYGRVSEDPEAWRYSAYESDLLSGVAQACAPVEVYPIVAMSGPRVDERAIQGIERIMGGGVFGTIVRTPNPTFERVIRTRLELNHPVVVVFPAHLTDWPRNAVDVDNLAVGEIAGRLLAGERRRRWVLVRDDVSTSAQLFREQGCRAIADEAGVEVHTVSVPVGLGLDKMRERLAWHIAEAKPDGLFGLTLHATVGTLLGCLKQGKTFPGDVSLVGCDSAYWHHSPDPRITSIDVSWLDTGVEAFRQLLQAADTAKASFDTVLLKPRVVPGDTCPVPPDLFEPA